MSTDPEKLYGLQLTCEVFEESASRGGPFTDDVECAIEGDGGESLSPIRVVYYSGGGEASSLSPDRTCTPPACAPCDSVSLADENENPAIDLKKYVYQQRLTGRGIGAVLRDAGCRVARYLALPLAYLPISSNKYWEEVEDPAITHPFWGLSAFAAALADKINNDTQTLPLTRDSVSTGTWALSPERSPGAVGLSAEVASKEAACAALLRHLRRGKNRTKCEPMRHATTDRLLNFSTQRSRTRTPERIRRRTERVMKELAQLERFHALRTLGERNITAELSQPVSSSCGGLITSEQGLMDKGVFSHALTSREGDTNLALQLTGAPDAFRHKSITHSTIGDGLTGFSLSCSRIDALVTSFQAS